MVRVNVVWRWRGIAGGRMPTCYFASNDDQEQNLTFQAIERQRDATLMKKGNRHPGRR